MKLLSPRFCRSVGSSNHNETRSAPNVLRLMTSLDIELEFSVMFYEIEFFFRALAAYVCYDSVFDNN